MRTAVDLNDIGLRAMLEHEGRTVEPRTVEPRTVEPRTVALGPSRGCAVFREGRLIVGDQAEAARRLAPLRTRENFWRELDEGRVLAPFPDSLRHADLVHAHLEGFRRLLAAGIEAEGLTTEGLDSALYAVSGSYSTQQLEWLTGIAGAAGLAALGLVDRALVAVAGSVESRQPVVHLELELHRAVVTLVETSAGRWTRGRVQVGERLGRAQLEEVWCRALASLFVRRTRFDPLHDAGSEQQLYDALPSLLVELAKQKEGRLVLGPTQATHAVEVSESLFSESARDIYERLLELLAPLAAAERTLAIGGHAAELPGFVDQARSRWPGRVVTLAHDAAARGALKFWSDLLPGEASDTAAQEGGGPIVPLSLALPLPSGGER